jgi:uncharacterized membrane protein YidH (DUF202 family)
LQALEANGLTAIARARFALPRRQSVNRPTFAFRYSQGELVSMHDIGKFLLIIGLVIALIGFIFWSGFAPKWLGRLPGDIRIERGNSVFYFPIVTCIVISILLTLIMSIFRR